MRTHGKFAGRSGGTRGVAAVEFALVLPMALVLLGGVIDTGLLLWAKSRLAGAVSAASHYAVLAGTAVSTTNVAGILTGSSGLTGVTATPVPVLTWNCPSGTPATFPLATGGSNSTCPNGDLAASFLTLSAHYTYKPLIPGYSHIATTALTETALVRLK
jgi:Flp pilus assembly protein TadG